MRAERLLFVMFLFVVDARLLYFFLLLLLSWVSVVSMLLFWSMLDVVTARVLEIRGECNRGEPTLSA